MNGEPQGDLYRSKRNRIVCAVVYECVDVDAWMDQGSRAASRTLARAPKAAGVFNPPKLQESS